MRAALPRLIQYSLLASLLIAALPASAAAQQTTIKFRQAPEGTFVDATATVPLDGAYIEKAGSALTAPVTSPTGGTLTASTQLSPGDAVRLYSKPGTLLASATFERFPQVHECMSYTEVTAIGTPPVIYAGVTATRDQPLDGPGIAPTWGTLSAPMSMAIFGNLEQRLVTLPRAVAPGDRLYAASGQTVGDVRVISEVSQDARCTQTQPPAEPQPQPQPTVPTDAEVLGAVKAAAVQSARALRSRVTPKRITFAVPEAGLVRVHLDAKGKRQAIGAGTSTGAKQLRVLLTRTAHGRRTLDRRGRLRLTLKVTFTPARAGGEPQRATVTVTRPR